MATKTVYICDQCGRSSPTSNHLDSYSVSDGIVELCPGCRATIMRWGLDNFPIPFKKYCKICNGQGYIKEFYGYNNDYDTKDCECKWN